VKVSLIFDLDGTLVDSLPGIVASLNRTLSAHGLPGHANAAIRSFVGDGVRSLVQRAAANTADLVLLASLVAFYKQDYDQSWADGTKAYPGIHNMLDELQKSGFQMAVLSNKTHDFTVAMTQEMFPSIHFAKVLGQRDGIQHKPHPAGALQLATTFGAAAENCVIIGDSAIDLETAANAEMQAIAVAWGYQDRAFLLASGASRIIDDPSELPGLLA